MIQEISNADIVFVGEVHDEPAHHDMEPRIIRSFHESDLPISVGLEMFRSDSQQDLNSMGKRFFVAGAIPAFVL